MDIVFLKDGKFVEQLAEKVADMLYQKLIIQEDSNVELIQKKIYELLMQELSMPVTLEWLGSSSHKLAKDFRIFASRTSKCTLCSMFFNDEGYSFDELDESEIEHFQQIVDSAGLPLRITKIK